MLGWWWHHHHITCGWFHFLCDSDVSRGPPNKRWCEFPPSSVTQTGLTVRRWTGDLLLFYSSYAFFFSFFFASHLNTHTLRFSPSFFAASCAAGRRRFHRRRLHTPACESATRLSWLCSSDVPVLCSLAPSPLFSYCFAKPLVFALCGARCASASRGRGATKTTNLTAAHIRAQKIWEKQKGINWFMELWIIMDVG